MSYILEALQKAQAERQLGEAPTIHAPTLEAGGVRAARNGQRPLVLALVLMGAAVAGLLAMLLRSPAPATGAAGAAQGQAPAAERAAVAAAVPAAVPAPVAAVAASTTPAAAPAAPTQAAPARTGAAPAATTLAAAPSAAAPAAVPVAPADATLAAAPAGKLAAKAGVKAGRAAGAAAQEGAQPPAPAAEAEERAQLLRELPEPIQRAIPPIAMSGYMYSKNPADRLILIDKVLRHEGEEVAPGLVLEKLQAKGAVFSFRGYRYRVPY